MTLSAAHRADWFMLATKHETGKNMNSITSGSEWIYLKASISKNFESIWTTITGKTAQLIRIYRKKFTLSNLEQVWEKKCHTPVSSFTSLTAASHISSPCNHTVLLPRPKSRSLFTDFLWCYSNNLQAWPTSSTTPVGNFHTPVPRKPPLFSWTTSTCFEISKNYKEKPFAVFGVTSWSKDYAQRNRKLCKIETYIWQRGVCFILSISESEKILYMQVKTAWSLKIRPFKDKTMFSQAPVFCLFQMGSFKNDVKEFLLIRRSVTKPEEQEKQGYRGLYHSERFEWCFPLQQHYSIFICCTLIESIDSLYDNWQIIIKKQNIKQ